jgi:hypothetical protein
MEDTKPTKEVELRPGIFLEHKVDIDYFNLYPAPLYEMLHSFHHTYINATIPFFGPMLYFLIRAMGCGKVLEVGYAEGYTAFYMAHAIKDNSIRLDIANAQYYGIDIKQPGYVAAGLAKWNLPATVMQFDSMNLESDTFKGVEFDLIFQDGCHDTEHVLHEMKVLYPQLKGNGNGIWVFHDCYGPAEEGFREVEKLIKAGVYKFEYCRIPAPYGLGILRKMDGFDYEKRFWV